MRYTGKKICVALTMCTAVLCAAFAVKSRDDQTGRQQEYEQLKKAYVALPEEAITEVAAAETEDAAEEIIYCSPLIDFEGLHRINPDIYAWLQIPGTMIDYPVLQSSEDNYYLTHNMDYSEGYPGCIYTNKINTEDFSDCITIMYGHNMKNGTMFAGLHLFEEQEFFEQNSKFTVYSEDARFTYEIYAALTVSDAYLPSLFDVKLADDILRFDDYLHEYADERKHFRDDVTLTEEDRLVVLSTCIGSEASKRYLVVGRLVETALYYDTE